VADPISVTVTGQQETTRALRQVKRFDEDEAAENAASALLPYIRDLTRKDSGRMAKGWKATDEAFINEVPYAVFQEFGTVWIEPTLALQEVWDTEGDKVAREYEKEIEHEARRAGFDTHGI